MHSWRIKSLALLAIFGGLAAGLGTWYLLRLAKNELPPISLSYRPSQIPGQGMVMGLTNTSADESLAGVHVDVTSPKEGEKRSYLLKKKLPPGDSISVGWMELDGWRLKRGDKVAVRCEGYKLTVEDEVPQR